MIVDKSDSQLILDGIETVINDELLQFLSPLGWEHINLTGDYPMENQFKGRCR